LKIGGTTLVKEFHPEFSLERPLTSNSTQLITHAGWNEAVNSRSRAPALERTALEALASSDKLARQEPRERCVPRQEPRNKDFNPHRLMFKKRAMLSKSGLETSNGRENSPLCPLRYTRSAL